MILMMIIRIFCFIICDDFCRLARPSDPTAARVGGGITQNGTSGARDPAYDILAADNVASSIPAGAPRSSYTIAGWYIP